MKILILLILMASNCFSQEVIPAFDDKSVPVLNDNLQSLNSNVVGVKTDLRALSAYFSNEILGTANGGTGLNNSATVQNSIPYFSGLGAMGNIGIGSTGYYLQSQGPITPPTWAAIASIPKVVYANKKQATVTADFALIGNAATATSTTALTTDGDWTSKNYLIVGEFSANSGSYTATDATAVIFTSGTTTAVTAAKGATACEGASGTLAGCIRSYAGYSANPTLSAPGSNQNGSSSCSIVVSGGNLAIQASGTTCDGSGGTCTKTANCEFSGIIIREP